MTMLTLALESPYGEITAEENIDRTTGTARYRVAGRRAAGTILVYPQPYGQDVIPTDINVEFGDGDHYNDRDRTDRPVINGTPIVGFLTFKEGDPSGVDEIHVSFMEFGRLDKSIGLGRLPKATRAYTWAIVRALVQHWRTRPDVGQLRLASARRTAAGRLPDLERTITKLREDATALLDSLMDKEQVRDELLALLENAPADQHSAHIPA